MQLDKVTPRNFREETRRLDARGAKNPKGSWGFLQGISAPTDRDSSTRMPKQSFSPPPALLYVFVHRGRRCVRNVLRDTQTHSHVPRFLGKVSGLLIVSEQKCRTMTLTHAQQVVTDSPAHRKSTESSSFCRSARLARVCIIEGHTESREAKKKKRRASRR